MDLKELREKYGLSQKELARILQINQSNVSRLESGEHELRVKHLAKLIKALNLSFKQYNSLIMDSLQDDEDGKN